MTYKSEVHTKSGFTFTRSRIYNEATAWAALAGLLWITAYAWRVGYYAARNFRILHAFFFSKT